MRDATQLLQAASAEDPRAAAELLPLVYDKLQRLTAHRLASERNNHTLQPTALVHEAWLKISGANERDWNRRQHFFTAAAEARKAELVKLRYFVRLTFKETAEVLGIAVPTTKQ